MKKTLLIFALLPFITLKADHEVCFDMAQNDEEIERELIREFYGDFKGNQYCVSSTELNQIDQERRRLQILSRYDQIEIKAYDYGHSSTLNTYLPTATVVIGSVVLGNLLSDHVLYSGQEDKSKHARVGGAISVASTLTSLYLAHHISDERLSPTMKKVLVGCSGFILSTLAGAAKEVYDGRKPHKHTKDIHDFYATSVGGGLGLGCSYSFKF